MSRTIGRCLVRWGFFQLGMLILRLSLQPSGLVPHLGRVCRSGMRIGVPSIVQLSEGRRTHTGYRARGWLLGCWCHLLVGEEWAWCGLLVKMGWVDWDVADLSALAFAGGGVVSGFVVW